MVMLFLGGDLARLLLQPREILAWSGSGAIINHLLISRSSVMCRFLMHHYSALVATFWCTVFLGMGAQYSGANEIRLDFDAPVPGTIADANGLGTGFTDRLPGTGTSLPTPDTNLSLLEQPGYLTITSTHASIAESQTWPQLEAVGLHVPSVGSNDIAISARLTNVHLPNPSDHLGIYAGTASGLEAHATLHLAWYGTGHQYLLSLSSLGGDIWGNPALSSGDPPLFAEGDTIDLTLARVNPKFQAKVERNLWWQMAFGVW